MNQKLSISMFAGGLATFLTSLGELLTNHQTWHELSSPHEIASVMIITGSFIFTVIGALGTKLPRANDQRIGDVDINKVEKGSLNDKDGIVP
jgi:hypothetical protein